MANIDIDVDLGMGSTQVDQSLEFSLSESDWQSQLALLKALRQDYRVWYGSLESAESRKGWRLRSLRWKLGNKSLLPCP